MAAVRNALVFSIFVFILAFMLKTTATVFLCLLGLTLVSSLRAETDLEMGMKRLMKAYKELALDLQKPDDANKTAYLALAGTMKSEAVKAHDLVPKKANDLPPDQKDAMVKAYQKSMVDFSASIDALTQAIQAGQWDQANKLIATLKMEETDGHKAFRKKEQPPPAPAAAPQSAPSTTPPPSAPAPAM